MPHSISTPTSPSLNCPPASLPLHTLHPTRLLRQPPPSGLYIAHSTNLATSPRTTPASSAITAAVAAALEAALQQAHMDRAAGLTHPNHLLRKLPTHASDDNKTILLPTAHHNPATQTWTEHSLHPHSHSTTTLPHWPTSTCGCHLRRPRLHPATNRQRRLLHTLTHTHTHGANLPVHPVAHAYRSAY